MAKPATKPPRSDGEAVDFTEQRVRMVERQLRRRGIEDERVLAAMAEVPREHFVPERVRDSAYNDSALPIGHEQTISQPWVVAAICQALRLNGDENVLEIGTGSGYSAAVLAKLARHVISIERVPELGEARAREARRARHRERRGDRRRRQPRLSRERPLRRDRVHAATPEAPHSLISELAHGRAPGRPDRDRLRGPAHCVHPPERRPSPGDHRTMPVRPPDRRRGLPAARSPGIGRNKRRSGRPLSERRAKPEATYVGRPLPPRLK